MATYLFAGASSAMAIKTASILKSKGHNVIGISTKQDNGLYDKLYVVEKYEFGQFPDIDEPVDGIAYFPGTINLKPFHRFTAEDFYNDYTVNALGAAAFANAYLPLLKKSKTASILFFSTVAVQAGMPFHASVAMAKGAVEGLTRSLAAELAPNIRVNCIAPSLTDTPLAEKLLSSEQKVDAAKARNPLKKIGSTEDIANAAAYLLSPDSGWITGQVLAVDGGMNSIRTL